MRGTINVGRPPQTPVGGGQFTCLAINLNGILLQRPGAYAVVAHSAGMELARSSFNVAPASAAPTACT